MTDLYSFNALDFSDVEPINDVNTYTSPSLSVEYNPTLTGSNLESRTNQVFELTKKGIFGLVMVVVATILNAVILGLSISLLSSSNVANFTKKYSYSEAVVLLLRPFSNDYMTEFAKSTTTKIIFITHMILMGVTILGLFVYLVKNFF